MKHKITIDYMTGADVTVLADKYSLVNGVLVVEEPGKTTIYPLYEVRTLTITVEQ